MRRYLPALPWLALALFGWLLWRTHDNSVRDGALAEARTVAAEQRADSAEAVSAAHLAALEDVKQDAERRIAESEKDGRRAEVRTRIAAAQVDTVVDSVRVLDPALGDSLSASIEREREGFRSAAEALRTQLAAQGEILAATNRALAAETIRADANLELANVWKERAERAEKPGMMARLRQAVVPLAVGVIGGVLLSR